MSYRTKQQDGVLEYLKKNAGRHVTAEDIREHARNGESFIGLATIYRQLERQQNQFLYPAAQGLLRLISKS